MSLSVHPSLCRLRGDDDLSSSVNYRLWNVSPSRLPAAALQCPAAVRSVEVVRVPPWTLESVQLRKIQRNPRDFVDSVNELISIKLAFDNHSLGAEMPLLQPRTGTVNNKSRSTFSCSSWRLLPRLLVPLRALQVRPRMSRRLRQRAAAQPVLLLRQRCDHLLSRE